MLWVSKLIKASVTRGRVADKRSIAEFGTFRHDFFIKGFSAAGARCVLRVRPFVQERHRIVCQCAGRSKNNDAQHECEARLQSPTLVVSSLGGYVST